MAAATLSRATGPGLPAGPAWPVQIGTKGFPWLHRLTHLWLPGRQLQAQEGAPAPVPSVNTYECLPFCLPFSMLTFQGHEDSNRARLCPSS